MTTDTRLPLAIHRNATADPHAETVILLHGLTEAGTTWPDLVERWDGVYNIVAPDHRGHGDSPRFTPEELGKTHEVMLADILSLLDEQEDPVILIGHSLGGNLALAAALARPDRIRAVVLEDPAAPSDAPLDGVVAENEAFLDSMATAEKRAAHIRRMLQESTWSRAEIEAWADSKPLVDRRYIREGLRLAEGPWEEAFQALQVPTLLVVPDPAPMAPRRQAVTNPLVQWAVIPDAGHCVRRDQPEAYFAAVERFLSQDVPTS